ncbi:MerC domain-containing protein [Croceicoccus sp. Ery15]|uniref:MerC domain-containing protein n=1 Tax=Croceicoccus sp. Ery15 TaxID=1703338 RepID=UPI001E342BAC|nr:MerC domain-containing protein [Croceicoccus sp. Ery15]
MKTHSPSCSHSPADRDARSRLDRLGIILSGACAIHCIAGLALVGLLGLGSLGEGHSFLFAPEIHKYGLVAAIVVGALTIGLGAIRHGHVLPLVLGALGIALMAIAVAGPHGVTEAVLTIAGVNVLALGHILNIRACSPRR